MIQNERYLTLISDLKEELFEALLKVQSFDVLRRAIAKFR
jgi:DNA-directed RNA polymerase specialized sigma54-like protein